MQVVFRPAPVPLRPIVDEAIAALGYFREDCAQQLAEIMEELWPRGVSSKMLASAKVDHLLTERGLVDRFHACEMTACRIISGVQRIDFAKRFESSGHFDGKVMLWARPELSCGALQGWHRSIHAWASRPTLPQPNCEREHCPCHFIPYFDD